jgi:phage terminase large subunit-like protein
MRYGLRVGPWPHAIVSTTPKNRLLIKELKKKADEKFVDEMSGQLEVVMTSATTAENPHLDQRVKNMLFDDYGNTRLGRQELYGEILEDVESALWRESMIEQHRILLGEQPENYNLKVVGIDPAVGGSNEHGIVVCGRVNKYRTHQDHPFSHLPHGFVLDDRTTTGTPNRWAKAAIQAYYDHDANYIVAERNNGGDMVKNTIHGIDPTVPVKEVWATRGKARRAEPISLMAEQGRIHHIGTFPDLERQMTEFDPVDPDDSWSPDRMDAMVWAMTELLVGGSDITTSQINDTRLRRRR